jgi:hypothetical protein
MARFNSLIIALAALLPGVFSHPANGPRSTLMGCGTEPTAEFLAKTEEFAAMEAGNSTIQAQFKAAATITIQTYFHVVAKSTAASGGYIPQSSLTQQLAVMNDNYGKFLKAISAFNINKFYLAPYGIQFVLAGTDYTVNSNWASDGAELAMKKKLRKGDYKTLNIYFQYEIGGNLGYCYFPTSVTTGSDDFYVSVALC